MPMTTSDLLRKSEISEALCWDDLADDYPGRARTRPMEEIFKWAEKQTDKYYVCPKEGTLHRKLTNDHE